MYRYKLRAECHNDIVLLVRALGTNHSMIMLNALQKGITDEEYTFDSLLTKEEIKKELLKIPDSHVMYETFEFHEKYTGERRYDYPK